MNIQFLSTLIVVVLAVSVIVIRLKASQYPTSAKKILMPPLGMSTGFLMFIAPQTHVSWRYVVIALLCGFVLSYPLVATSKMYVADGNVYLKRSRGFVVILLTLLIVRLLLHQYIEEYVSLPQTGALFFILAYGMIVPWRIVMYLNYRKLAASTTAGEMAQEAGH